MTICFFVAVAAVVVAVEVVVVGVVAEKNVGDD